MKGKLFLAIALVAAALATSCAPVAGDDGQPQILSNLPYGADALNTLDAYIPADGGGGHGAVILIHGGSWIAGDKSDFGTEYPLQIVERGYVAVAMNYRLAAVGGSNAVLVGDMLDDIDAVRAYVAGKAADWGCDATRIALVGVSAGGHLALLDALTRGGASPVPVCVSLSGPTDFTDPDFQDNPADGGASTVLDGLMLVTGATGEATAPETLALFEAASPVLQVPASLASRSFLMAHGTLDALVPVAQARAMKTALEAAGATVVWYESPDDGHSLSNCAPYVMLGLIFPLLDRTLR